MTQDEINQLAGVIGTIAGTFIPGGTIAGMGIEQLVKVGAGVIGGVSSAVELYQAAQSGTPPTPEQLAKAAADSDAAHADLQAAADAVIAKG